MIHYISLLVQGIRIRNFQIIASDTMPDNANPPDVTHAGSSLCYAHPGAPDKGIQVLAECQPVAEGSVVIVTLPEPDFLTLCEVEVYCESLQMLKYKYESFTCCTLK